MKTLEMMNIAKDTNKKFKTEDLYYTYKDGFTDKTGKQWSGRAFTYINKLFEIDDWEEVKQPATWQEAIQAWIDGKSFRVEVDGTIYFQHYDKLIGYLGRMDELNNFKGISLNMLVNGKFYIED